VKRKLSRLALGIAVLASLAMVGCGGGEGSGSPPSKAAFVRKGNLTCAEGINEKEELRAKAIATQQRNHGRISQKKGEQYTAELMDIYEGEAERLADLVPPVGDEKKIEALVSAMKEAAARYRANPEAGGVPFGKPGRMAQDYGLDKCAVS